MGWFIKSDNVLSVKLKFHDMPFRLPYKRHSLQKQASFAVAVPCTLCFLEGQVECIRKLSELKVGPVLVNQLAHLDFFD